MSHMTTEDSIESLPAHDQTLPREFYGQLTTVVARNVLGCTLVSTVGPTPTAGRIVEVEAYLGSGDPAAHSYNGPTPRTRIQWGPPGHAYIYLIYGMYHCLNFITEPKGTPGCVLIRALEPLDGFECMSARRNLPKLRRDICNGPGKLTQALGIDRTQNGNDLLSEPLFVLRGPPVSDVQVRVSPRIGLVHATQLPLRFFVHNNEHVSRHRFNRDATAYSEQDKDWRHT